MPYSFASNSQSANPRVYIVDDEVVIGATLATILSAHGFNAIAFSRPEDALEKALQSAPDLLLTDVTMEGMTGIELALQVRTFCPNCKLLLFSGHAETGDLLEREEHAGRHFEILAKPFHPDLLLATIREIMTKNQEL